jgi:hypothetical protein
VRAARMVLVAAVLAAAAVPAAASTTRPARHGAVVSYTYRVTAYGYRFDAKFDLDPVAEGIGGEPEESNTGSGYLQGVWSQGARKKYDVFVGKLPGRGVYGNGGWTGVTVHAKGSSLVTFGLKEDNPVRADPLVCENGWSETGAGGVTFASATKQERKGYAGVADPVTVRFGLPVHDLDRVPCVYPRQGVVKDWIVVPFSKFKQRTVTLAANGSIKMDLQGRTARLNKIDWRVSVTLRRLGR